MLSIPPVPALPLDLATARLFDFFGRRTPWHRRLWSGGLLTSLEETAEFGEAALAVDQGHEQSTAYRRFLRDEVLADPGIGAPHEAQLVTILGAKTFSAQSIRELRHLRAQVSQTYFENWRAAATAGDAALERLARALASTLLDAGFSPSGLHRWLQGLVRNNPPASIEDVIDAAGDRLRLPGRNWHVVVPVEQVPFRRHPRPSNFLDAPQARTLLPQMLPKTRMVRLNGALAFTITAKDEFAAATAAADQLGRVAARVTVGLPGEAALRAAEIAWVYREDADHALGDWAPLRESQRSVEVGTLYRQQVVFELPDHAAALDDAFQLLAAIETGSPGSAIAGGWAAIESLLRGPAERGGEIAARRIAAIVTCSLPRAELTPLAHRYREEQSDALADELAQLNTNLALAETLEAAIRAGRTLVFEHPSDAAALARVAAFIMEPKTLVRVNRYFEMAFLRLYRLRNRVMHGGSAKSVATPSVVGTMPALIGAGIDRISHAVLSADPRMSPLGLAARATVNLAQAQSGSFSCLSRLLEAP
jgi:hypothetical protein